MTARPIRSLLLAPLLTAALLVSGCAVNPVSGKKEVMMVSEEQEIAMGKEAHEDVKKEYGVYDNPKLQAYVNEVGQKLAKQSHRANLQWHFTVVDSSEINAFALPGGYVYITRGLMAYLNSEAELSGVLGHEIGHVTARHGAKRETQGTIAGILAVGAEIFGQAVLGAEGAGNVVSQAASGLILKYGREQESQSDELGAQYLSRSGYDPKTMVTVIGVLKHQEQFADERAKAEGRKPQRMPDWLSSHPSNDQRLADITEIAKRYPPVAADGGRERYLRAIDGITFGDSREQGVVRGQNFYHEPLGFVLTVPPGWRYQNSAAALLAVNPAGDAAVVLQGVTGKGNTHEEIIRNVLKPRDGRVERTQIHGLAATNFAGTSVNQQNQPVPVEATVITLNNQQYLMAHLGKDANAIANARPGMREVIGSFRAFTPQDRDAARPYVLRVGPLAAGQTLANAARYSPVSAYAEQQLRLLNGVYPQGEPKTGQLVKWLAQ